MNTLWQEEEFEQICSRKLLTKQAAEIGKIISVKSKQAAEIGKMISVKEHDRECHDFDPKMFYENRF